MWVGYRVVALFGSLAVTACGDDSCQEARDVEEGITRNAEEVDKISSVGLCTLSEAEVASRLSDQNPLYAEMTRAQARAKEYVANCKKLRELKAECGD